MSILAEKPTSAVYRKGHIVVKLKGAVDLRFPVAGNPRLAKGTPRQLNNIEVSPFGLHWPDLDEDLSFCGLLEGDYGQQTPASPKGRGRRAVASR